MLSCTFFHLVNLRNWLATDLTSRNVTHHTTEGTWYFMACCLGHYARKRAFCAWPICAWLALWRTGGELEQCISGSLATFGQRWCRDCQIPICAIVWRCLALQRLKLIIYFIIVGGNDLALGTSDTKMPTNQYMICMYNPMHFWGDIPYIHKCLCLTHLLSGMHPQVAVQPAVIDV